MVNQAIEDYIQKTGFDSAIPREVGIDKEGNYYFYLSGIINEDPDGDWDYDEYYEGDSPYYVVELGEDGIYKNVTHICDLDNIQVINLINNKSFLLDKNKKLIPKLPKESDKPLEVSEAFCNMVINEREPKGIFFFKSNEDYIGVDNKTGEAWTEVFVDKNTCLEWLKGDFEYYSDFDYGKVLVDGELKLPNKTNSKDDFSLER